jgi:Flp pilus assembly protein TadB
MSPLLLAMIGALVMGTGAYLLVNRLAPAPPDLKAGIKRITPSKRDADYLAATGDWNEARFGALLADQPNLIARIRVPETDLAIMDMTTNQFYGRKAKNAGLGLLLGLMLTTLFSLFISPVALSTQLLLSIGAAVGLWFLTNMDLHDKAEKRRKQFTQILTSYTELVALSRKAGNSTRAALFNASQVGPSWVFVWIQEELDKADLNGTPVGQALGDLAHRIDVKALSELADIMELAKEGNVYESLRARARSSRAAILYEEKAEANSAVERIAIPLSVMVVIYMIGIGAPALLTFMGTGR